MERSWRLAVDFGTSNTAAAHQSGTHPPATLPLTHQSDLIPSAVFLGPEGFEVGPAALNRAPSDPSAFVASPKRLLDTERAVIGSTAVPATAPVEAVFRRVLSAARARYDGSEPDQVVLTHPEAWPGIVVERLVRAAAGAGVDRSRLTTLSEPRAAAHFYSGSQSLPGGSRVAVFDYGGGTLDIAVLEAARDGEFRVVAARGDVALGGRNIDVALRRWVDEQLADDHPEVLDHLHSGASPSALHVLDQGVRSAKELLSDTSSATITVPGPGREVGLLLTRDEFIRILAPEADRAVELTRSTIADAGAGEEIRALFLTGGTSRIPHLQDRLGELGRVATLDDPKTVVCRGALLATLPRSRRPQFAAHPAVPTHALRSVPGTDRGGSARPRSDVDPDPGFRDSDTPGPFSRTGVTPTPSAGSTPVRPRGGGAPAAQRNRSRRHVGWVLVVLLSLATLLLVFATLVVLRRV